MRRLLLLAVVAAATMMVPLQSNAGNQEVADLIARTLGESGQLYGSDVNVRYQNGVVWLKGSVCTHEQKEAAAKLVLETPGVVRVMNEVVVAEDGLATELQLTQGAIQPEHHPQSTTESMWPSTSRPVEEVQKVASQPKPAQLRQPQVAPERSASQVAAVRRPSPIAQPPRPMPQEFVIPASAVAAEPVAPNLPLPQSTASMQPTVAPPRPMADKALPAAPASIKPAVDRAIQQANTVSPPVTPPQQMPTLATRPVSHPHPQPVAVAGTAPIRMAYSQPVGQQPTPVVSAPQAYVAPVAGQVAGRHYDQPNMPAYAWPSYAPYPNYAQVCYPKQYSPQCWPYIGPYYPYPQVPLGWRKVTMEWHDGWWYLDFNDGSCKSPFSPFLRPFAHRHQ